MDGEEKIKKDRKWAIRVIEESFLSSLKENGIELSESEKVLCRINGDRIEVGISTDGEEMDFSSVVEIYTKTYDNEIKIGKKENEINIPNSGSFNPSEKGSYYKIIHAASILKHWDIVSEIVDVHCRMYRDLVLKIHKQ